MRALLVRYCNGGWHDDRKHMRQNAEIIRAHFSKLQFSSNREVVIDSIILRCMFSAEDAADANLYHMCKSLQ